MQAKGIAARAAHWSATHRKKAILIWVAFVVVALFAGSAVGQREMTDTEAMTASRGPPRRQSPITADPTTPASRSWSRARS